MQRPFYFSICLRHPAAGFGIIGAVEFDDIAIRILDDFFTFDDVGVTETHFLARSEAEKFTRRIFHEIFLLDVEFARKRHIAHSGGCVFWIVDGFELFDAIFGKIRDDDFQRIQHSHDAGGTRVQIFADAMFEQRHVDHAFLFRDTDSLCEIAHGFRRITPAAQSGDRRHARVVPPVNDILLHEEEQFPLAHHHVRNVEACKFDLLRMVNAELVDIPVIEGAMVFELQRTDGMRDAFDGI